MTLATHDTPYEDRQHPSADDDQRALATVARRLRAEPTVLRTYVTAAMLPEYLTLASAHDYLLFVDWRLTSEGSVRLVFCRQQVVEDAPGRDPGSGTLAPTGTD